jgi:Ulp1 family protease
VHFFVHFFVRFLSDFCQIFIRLIKTFIMGLMIDLCLVSCDFLLFSLFIMRNLVYPTKEDPKSIEINDSCLACLSPTEYLNDDVMNFFILYLKTTFQEYQKSPVRSQFVLPTFGFASTFLFTKITMKNKDEDSIVRWFKHFNLLSYDYSFIPLHDKQVRHWKLLIVDSKKQTIHLLDSLVGLGEDNEDQMYNFLFFLYLLYSFLSCLVEFV